MTHPRSCNWRCTDSRENRLCRAVIEVGRRCVHTFGRPPSDDAPSLRTHVPPLAKLNACAARARCRSPHTLVPTARGRLRRRLGGRLGRACRGPSSAPSGAAQAREDPASRAAARAGTRLPVPGQPPSGPAPGPSPGERTQRRAERGSRVAPRRLPAVDPAAGPNSRQAARRRPIASQKTGGVLLSQALASQVPSALRGLTALFGMGRGVSPSPKPPEKHERPRLPGPSKLHSATAGTTKKSVKPSTH